MNAANQPLSDVLQYCAVCINP